MVAAIGIVGRQSNVGKTEVTVRIVKELKARGLRVATLKHDVHGFQMDQPGKDTFRHYEAGADIVMISSKEKMAMIRRVEDEYSLDDLLSMLTDVDIVVVEGYKNSTLPKVEVLRKGVNEDLFCAKESLIGVVADFDVDLDGVMLFPFSDITPLVEKIISDVIK